MQVTGNYFSLNLSPQRGHPAEQVPHRLQGRDRHLGRPEEGAGVHAGRVQRHGPALQGCAGFLVLANSLLRNMNIQLGVSGEKFVFLISLRIVCTLDQS